MIAGLIEIDRALFVLLNGEWTHPVLDVTMPFTTTQGNWYPILVGLWIALIIWGGRKGRITALLLVLAVAFADQITCGLLKPLVARIRPCNAMPEHQLRLLVGCSQAYSFPSAHASNSFAMASVVSWRFSRVAPLAFAVAGVVAYSRVYVGVHYPFDVIAGALLGMAIGKFLSWVGNILDRRWKSRLDDAVEEEREVAG